MLLLTIIINTLIEATTNLSAVWNYFRANGLRGNTILMVILFPLFSMYIHAHALN